MSIRGVRREARQRCGHGSLERGRSDGQGKSVMIFVTCDRVGGGAAENACEIRMDALKMLPG